MTAFSLVVTGKAFSAAVYLFFSVFWPKYFTLSLIHREHAELQIFGILMLPCFSAMAEDVRMSGSPKKESHCHWETLTLFSHIKVLCWYGHWWDILSTIETKDWNFRVKSKSVPRLSALSRENWVPFEMGYMTHTLDMKCNTSSVIFLAV